MLVSLLLRGLFNQSNYHGLDFIEFSSGRGNLSCELLRQGLVGAAFDIANEDCHDCLTSQGLRLWLDALTATGRAALTWWGTECSSFVILCKCQSCREVSNDFLGDESRPFVRRGNCLMEITALLMLLSFWLGNVCVLEQPLNSVMPRAPSLSHVLAFIQANKYVTYIGAFGGETTKPLQIWSSHSFLRSIVRSRPESTGLCLATRDGHGRFTGVKGLLQDSSAYTCQFGAAVACAFLRSRTHG